jgi:hypothetical protein
MKQNPQHFRPPRGIKRAAWSWLNEIDSSSGNGVGIMPKIFLSLRGAKMNSCELGAEYDFAVIPWAPKNGVV